MKNIDLPKVASDIENFVNERDWDQFHSVKNLTMALSVETAELVEIFQWMTEEKSNAIKTDPEVYSRVADELADIAVYLIRLSQKTGIDLESAIRNKLFKNSKKYPVELAKGSAKKYTELK